MTARRDLRMWIVFALFVSALIFVPIGIFLWQNHDQEISVTLRRSGLPGGYVADISSGNHELCINTINVVVLAYGVWPTFPTPRVYVDSFRECHAETKSLRTSVPISLNGYDPTTLSPGRVCLVIFYRRLDSHEDFHTKVSCE